MAKNMSFLPEDYLEKRIQRRTNVICISLFLVVMASVAGAFYVTDQQRGEVRRQQQDVDRQFEDAAKRLEQLDKLQERKSEMIRKAKVTSVLVERVPRSVLLAELINHMPASLSLLELDMETKVINVPSSARTALDKAKEDSRKNKDKSALADQPEVKPTEVLLTLVGIAPTDVQVAQYMTALGRTPLFYDQNLLYSEQVTIDEQEMRKFRIDLKLNQEVDERKLSPTRVRRDLKQNPMDDQIEIDADGRLRMPRTEPASTVVAPANH